jgi:glutamate synthase domain-containing protein 3
VCITIPPNEPPGSNSNIPPADVANTFTFVAKAGGMVVLLGLDLAAGEFHRASFIGTGMHGGAIYIRGEVQDHQLGKEVGVQGVEGEDRRRLEEAVRSFAGHFDLDAAGILAGNFRKLYPKYLRPYGTHYAY